MKLSYKTTMLSCFAACGVQAVIINFPPLLFVHFQDTYHIPLSQITLLVTVTFVVQLLTDFLATQFVDRIGYRASMLFAHVAAVIGLVALTVLPEIMDPLLGLLIAVSVYSVGGGIIEVLASPLIESCPTDNKEKAMSLMHSFYCWGLVCMVLISTAFFRVFGIHNWKIMALIWTVIPAVNALLFIKTPIAPLIASGEKGMTMGQLLKNRTFWLLAIIMICSGASEHGVAMWSSAFAEKGLNIDKTLGDLAGPMAFAVVMGVVRSIHGKYGEKMNLDKLLLGSAALCVAAYLTATLFRSPVINLIGCGLCGVAVALMWPGTMSKAAATLPTGGTTMFALLALAGDVGCTAGPTLVGMISDAMDSNLKKGILAGTVFPAILLLCLLLWKKPKKDGVK